MKVLALLAFLGCPFSPQGFRVTKRRATDQQPADREDVVDAIYTFGAPGTASPGLVNQRTKSGCFNGLRTYQSQPGSFFGKFMDPVAFITNPISYWHSKLAAREVDTRNPGKYPIRQCTDVNVSYVPLSFLDGTGNTNMHIAEKYLKTVLGLGDKSLETFAVFALVFAYLDDAAQVAAASRERGWKLVGKAEDLSLNFTQGPQKSHLFQNRETLECVITFEGTQRENGLDDWYANFETTPEKFCGLVDEDEVCNNRFGECKVRRAGGAFVHRGFVNKARSVAMTEGWKQTIQGNLGACSKVSLVGHSAGGAAAELVAGCLSKKLAPNDYGYDDRALFAWTPTEPAELPDLDTDNWKAG